jgi:predicted TPR repeat methyltransferase
MDLYYKMFDGHYVGWRNARMSAIMKYVTPDYFNTKTLLELGCGHAHVGNMFHELGAVVTSADIREEYLEVIKQIYPHIETKRVDGMDLVIESNYDVILHWGLLYHLSEIQVHLERVSQKCNVLLLETEVSFSDDKDYFQLTNEEGYDQAFYNTGIRPSQKYVENLLDVNGFQYVLIKDPILNSDFHRYDWDITNEKPHAQALRRFWICWKNVPSPLNPDVTV